MGTVGFPSQCAIPVRLTEAESHGAGGGAEAAPSLQFLVLGKDLDSPVSLRYGICLDALE